MGQLRSMLIFALAAPLVVTHCRLSYELLDEAGGDGIGGATGSGGEGGAAVGGSDTGGSEATGGSTTAGGGAGGSGGTGGSAGTVGDYDVTTGSDENDPGATVEAPGGSGLSLREAILLANAAPGHQVITSSVPTVTLSSGLPYVTESADLVGNGTVVDASALASGDCIRLDASDILVRDFEFLSCPDTALFVRDSNAVIVDNRVFGSESHGIFVSATNTVIIGNLLVRTGGIMFHSTSVGTTVWFNTIVATTGSGLVAGQSADVDFRNNIATDSSSYGVEGACDKFTAYSHNLLFGNSLGAYNGCAPGADTLLVDPQFTSPGTDDYSLLLGSPAVDAGTDVGADRNGAGTGNYDGNAPDMGYLERN